MFSLPGQRGYLSDWVTRQWVRVTGRRVNLLEQSWLDGPVGNLQRIGKEFFDEYARSRELVVVRGGPRGLIQDFGELCQNHSGTVAAGVRDFYERTSEFELDVWSEWSGLFRPFGRALAVIFSRRLQQLNHCCPAISPTGSVG